MRTPITPVRLDPKDIQVFEDLRVAFGLKTRSDAIRLAGRFMLAQKASPKQVKKALAAFDQEYKGCVKLEVVC